MRLAHFLVMCEAMITAGTGAGEESVHETAVAPGEKDSPGTELIEDLWKERPPRASPRLNLGLLNYQKPPKTAKERKRREKSKAARKARRKQRRRR